MFLSVDDCLAYGIAGNDHSRFWTKSISSCVKLPMLIDTVNVLISHESGHLDIYLNIYLYREIFIGR